MRIVFGKEEKYAILLLTAVIAISCLLFVFLEDAGKERFASPYSPSADTGELVFFEGISDEIIYTKTGGHIIVKSGDTRIFIRNGAGRDNLPEPGMMIQAVGTVEIYEGEKEICVSDLSDVVFMNKTPS